MLNSSFRYTLTLHNVDNFLLRGLVIDADDFVCVFLTMLHGALSSLSRSK